MNCGHIASEPRWTLPNGLKIDGEGRIFIADYRRGILRLDPGQPAPLEVLGAFRSEGFRGCNDLFLSAEGDLWFTDQGQTGLHDPSGRVFCLDTTGGLRCVLNNVPSPNGLVMNASENGKTMRSHL